MIRAVVIRVRRVEGVRWETRAFPFSVVVGPTFDENDGDKVRGEDANVAVAEVDGGKVNILDELVEVEEGICCTAGRVLWVGG